MKRLTKNKLNVQNLVSRNGKAQKLSKHLLRKVPAVVNSNNMLGFIYERLIEFPNLFREKVCEECNFSVPTFYRKIRGEEKALSNAEREKITSIEKECIRYLMGAAGMTVADFPGETT